MRNAFSVFLCLGVACAGTDLSRKDAPPITSWAETTLGSLSLEEKIGQMVNARRDGGFLNGTCLDFGFIPSPSSSITIPKPGKGSTLGSWTATHFGIWDAASSGNLLHHGALFCIEDFGQRRHGIIRPGRPHDTED